MDKSIAARLKATASEVETAAKEYKTSAEFTEDLQKISNGIFEAEHVLSTSLVAMEKHIRTLGDSNAAGQAVRKLKELSRKLQESSDLFDDLDEAIGEL